MIRQQLPNENIPKNLKNARRQNQYAGGKSYLQHQMRNMKIATKTHSGGLLGIPNPLPIIGALATAVGQPIMYIRQIWDAFTSTWETIKEAAYNLPDLEIELALFIEQSEGGAQADLKKQILYQILDMNRRYLQLNTTAAKRAFNQIIHITTINSIRNPRKASEYLAKAELDLAKLFRAYLGSVSEKSDDTTSYSQMYDYIPYEVQSIADTYNQAKKWYYGDIQRNAAEPSADDVASKYEISEPISILDRQLTESKLPSDILYRTEFPEAGVTNRFAPSYEMRVPDAPMDIVSIYKKRPVVKPKKRKHAIVRVNRGRDDKNTKHSTRIARRNKKYY